MGGLPVPSEYRPVGLCSCFALSSMAAFLLACHSSFTPAKTPYKPLYNLSFRDFGSPFDGFCTSFEELLLILKGLLASFRKIYLSLPHSPPSGTSRIKAQVASTKYNL